MRNRILAAAFAAALIAAAPIRADAGPISSYPAAATPLSGSETVIGTQGGSTVQITAASIAAIVTAATNTWTGVQTFPAPGSGHGSVVLTPGTATGTPPNGSIWVTSTGLDFQAGGATQQAVGNGANAWTAVQTFAASSGSAPSVILTPGSAPSSPANGGLWATGSGLFGEIGGSALQFATTGANIWTGEQSFTASSASNAGVNLGQGTGPTSPVNGDLWVTTNGVFARVNGSTAALGVTVPTAAAGGSNTQIQYNCSAVLCGATGFGYTGGETLIGPDGTTWKTTGIVLGPSADFNINGGFIVSGSTPLIGFCAGSWLIGPSPSFCTSTGGDNIGIGTIVFQSLTSGASDVAIGSENGRDMTTGSFNTIVGFEAGHILTTGSENAVLGAALNSEQTGNGNVAVGHAALQDQDGASDNIGVGAGAGSTITTGSNEICVGVGACPTLTTGAHNIMIGSEGYGIVAGHGNVDLGNYAGTLSDQNDSISISDGDGNLLFQYLVGNGYATLAQPLRVTGYVKASTFLNIMPTTVSGLSTADPSPAAGDRAFVTDATACTFGSTLTGSSSTKCPVYYDGSAWRAG